jgi:predicted nucleic acid-binding Zn ribbon protein
LIFKQYLIPKDSYECHGCTTREDLTAIELPNLCNQQLVLCPNCKEKLGNTLKEKAVEL